MDWKNKRVTIVGGDQKALEAAAFLKREGAIVKVANPWFKAQFSKLGVHLDQTYDTAQAVADSDYVLCLSDDPAVNKSTAADAIRRNIPVWCPDDPQRTTFDYKGTVWGSFFHKLYMDENSFRNRHDRLFQ